LKQVYTTMHDQKNIKLHTVYFFNNSQ